MTKTCCVPGCKSNYNSTLKAGVQLVSTFSFPKDELLRGKWLRALPRDNWFPSQYSVVCGLHFPESDIIRKDNYLLPDGTIQKIPTRTRLSPNAVPSIFPHLPRFKSKKVTRTRKSRVERGKSGSSCMVLFCKTQGMIPGISYFRLTSTRHDSWLRALGRDPDIEHLTHSNRVCSIHFSENDFLRHNNQIIGIKPGAVPTKLLGIKKAPVPVDNIPVTTSKRPRVEVCDDEFLDRSILSKHEEILIKDEDGQSRSDIVDNINHIISSSDGIKTELTDTEDKYKTDSVANDISFTTLKKPKEVCVENFLDSPMLFKQEEIMVKDEDGQNIINMEEQINKEEVLDGCSVMKQEEIVISDDEQKGINMEENISKKEFLDSCTLVKQEETIIGDDEQKGSVAQENGTLLLLVDDKIKSEIIENEKKCETESFTKEESCENIKGTKEELPIEEFSKEVGGASLEFSDNLSSVKQEEIIMEHEDEQKRNSPNLSAFYKCDKCEYQTVQKAAISKHILLHANPGDAGLLQCFHCDYQTLQRRYLIRHLYQHRETKDEESFKCDQCNYQAKHKSYLKKHYFVHQKPDETVMYKCVHCDYKSGRKDCLNLHSVIHKNPEELIRYKCDQCDYQAIRKSEVKRHYRIHQKADAAVIYKCDQCDYQTIWKNYLGNHLKLHREPDDVVKYKCKKCDYQSISKSLLRRHSIIHENPEDLIMYKCYHCDHQTKWKYSLVKHLLVHRASDAVVKYKCDECAFESTRKYELKRHSMKHQTLIMFKCKQCDYQTVCRGFFKKHNLIHKKQGKGIIHKCGQCDFHTFRKKNLKSHVSKYHV